MQNCRKNAAISAKMPQNIVNLKGKYYGNNNIRAWKAKER